ncbi:MAG: major capsid protein [Microviridae sp.]|nr:MAG: major capsid protein [Microviridae sp.]
METTLGGDRLGSGNKQQVSFRNYERSSHDLGFVWRSSMASGTLVPFMSRVGLPGDKWEIDLNCEVLTLPTIGPLFGSYKVQLDVFEIPMRLYNAKLHMNKLGVGMDMKSIYLPQIELQAVNKRQAGFTPTYEDNEQINPSSLAKYLGVSGLGSYSGVTNPVTRKFNAIPFLALWDIYKNYYSNKQEEVGYYVHTDSGTFNAAQTPTGAKAYDVDWQEKGDCLEPTEVDFTAGDKCVVQFPLTAKEPKTSSVIMQTGGTGDTAMDVLFNLVYWEASTCRMIGEQYKGAEQELGVKVTPSIPAGETTYFFGLKKFDLANIDTMRERILQHATSNAFLITDSSLEPYNCFMQNVTLDGLNRKAIEFSQEGLPIKTYQSDLFNNWINTEWIDGAGGISELTAVDTSGGDFTIDALNIASKVYDMLNRIAVSGGTYDNWLEAVYTHERVKGVESPVYCGSLIKELAFEEVVSLAETNNSEGRSAPLGTLAGRGRLTGKNKGGKVTISVNEPSYIMGIVSITPRIDYSQGNEWDMNLKTYDDFHKPALDGIGFQDLITEQLLWSDTNIDSATGELSHKSLGKQPAWINYMTAVNKTYGNFAEQNNSMFMTLNRRYERKTDGSGDLKDGTTYIDPTKFNNIFAEVSLDSQNFWVQIAANITARRKMSAKIIPNL